MTVVRTSISMSLELDQALGILVARTGQPKSKVIEMLLRENSLIQDAVETMRLEFKTTPAAVRGRRPAAKARQPATPPRA
jgi:hypothetical protein